MRKTIIAAAFVLFASPAFAIDFTQTIKTFDGVEFKDETGKDVPQVLGTVIENALLATQPNDTPDEKNKRFWLADKLHKNAKDFAPSPEEVVTMKKALSLMPIAVMGQATKLIDPSYGK
jgi:hypothetical protein